MNSEGVPTGSLTPNTLSANASTQPPTQASSEAELYQSPQSDSKAESTSHFGLHSDDEETIFVHESSSAIAPTPS